jgi:sugar phosphate isomerase/epimerase
MAGAAACSRSSGAAQSGATVGAASRRRLERIGIQLYSVRQDVQRDMAATLARLAEIGYREVEFAGYFGKTPDETRRLLEQNRLTAPSTHIGYDQLKTNWDRALDDAVARGHRYITIPYLPNDVRVSKASWQGVAEEFNRGAERARARGLAFAYHNHDFEFVRVEGVIPFDLLLAETDPALVSFEMDVYWTVKAGGDPLAYFRQHPARFPMLHIKDSAGPPAHQQVDVGAGTIDFASILRLDAGQRGVVKHVFIEHDQPQNPLAFAKASYDHLSRMEY